MATSDPQAQEILRRAFVCDLHGCMPLRPGDSKFLPQLRQYRDAGVDVVGLNVGFDAVPWQQTVAMLAHFRRWIRTHSKTLRHVREAADLKRVPGRLGVFFDIEGGAALNDQLSMVELYRDLGVRWMLIAYNRNNSLGGGCQDVDRGLTRFGKAVVREMERVGMTVCCSHTGYRTTMDVMRQASRPVIFSHSNALGVWRHSRNVKDAAMRACAATGGLIGINGIGIFLGDRGAEANAVADHIDYVVERAGIDHVAIGLDYVFDQDEVDAYVHAHPELFPKEGGYASGVSMLGPARLHQVISTLLSRGYRARDLEKILGRNFLRVAKATWSTEAVSE